MFTGDDHDRDGWITGGEVESYTLKAGNLGGGPGQWGLRLDSTEPGDVFARLRYRIGSYRLTDATFGARSERDCLDTSDFPNLHMGTVMAETVLRVSGSNAYFSRPDVSPSLDGMPPYCSDYAFLSDVTWFSEVRVAESFVNPPPPLPANVPAPPALVFLLTAAGALGAWKYAGGKTRAA